MVWESYRILFESRAAHNVIPGGSVQRTTATALRAATAVLAFAVSAPAAAEQATVDRTIPVRVADDSAPRPAREIRFTFGGAVKLDVLYSMFPTGAVEPQSTIRSFYDPRGLPIEEGGADAEPHSGDVSAKSGGHSSGAEVQQYLDFHAKETRFFFAADGRLAGGQRIGGFVEADFLANPGAGTETVTNAYTPALRRAFVAYEGLLVGQDWTTFQNLDAYPDMLDYIGAPASGAIYVRQPLIRYTVGVFLGGDWQVALENAETWMQPRDGTVSAAQPVTEPFATGDSQLPDAVLRYDWNRRWGSVALATLVRQLRADGERTGGDAPADTANGTETGYGLSLSGRIPVTLEALRGDDIRFMVTYGEGIGRYVALGVVPDAVVDENNGLKPTPLLAGYFVYRRAWTPEWRTSFGLSHFSARNDRALAGPEATARVNSLHMNFLYSPVESVTFGVELFDAHRYVEDGGHGELHRFQLSARFTF